MAFSAAANRPHQLTYAYLKTIKQALPLTRSDELVIFGIGTGGCDISDKFKAEANINYNRQFRPNIPMLYMA